MLRRSHQLAIAAAVVGLGVVGYLVLRNSGSDATPATAASAPLQAEDSDPATARQRAWATQFARREAAAPDPAQTPTGARALDPAAPDPAASGDKAAAEVDPRGQGSAGAGSDAAAAAFDAREAKVRKLFERLNQKKPAIERVRGASVAREILTKQFCTAADAQQRYRSLSQPERAKMRQRCAPYNVTFAD